MRKRGLAARRRRRVRRHAPPSSQHALLPRWRTEPLHSAPRLRAFPPGPFPCWVAPELEPEPGTQKMRPRGSPRCPGSRREACRRRTRYRLSPLSGRRSVVSGHTQAGTALDALSDTQLVTLAHPPPPRPTPRRESHAVSCRMSSGAGAGLTDAPGFWSQTCARGAPGEVGSWRLQNPANLSSLTKRERAVPVRGTMAVALTARSPRTFPSGVLLARPVSWAGLGPGPLTGQKVSTGHWPFRGFPRCTLHLAP